MDMKFLKDTVDEISLTREQQEEIITRLKGPGVMIQYRSTRRIAGILLGIVCVGMILAIPAKAMLQSVLQERFGDMPKEEAVSIAEEMDRSEVVADSFSREYTKGEKARMEDLTKSYQNGIFPEKELLQVKTLAETEGEELYFLIPDSFFQLPERELTDEELLSIIDYRYKMDYSLSVRYEEEFDAEVKEQKVKEQKGMKEIAENGGITQTEAVDIAQGYLKEIFGVSQEGKELTCYLVSQDEEAFPEFDEPVYAVIYSIKSNVNYYFYLNAYDGSMVQMLYSSVEMLDAYKESVTIEEVESSMAQMYGQAAEFLEKKLKLGHDYVKTTCEYTKNSTTLYGIGVSFCFIKEDGSFDKVRIAVSNKEICEYSSMNSYESYQESLRQNMELRSELEEEQDMEHATMVGEVLGAELVVKVIGE